MKISHNRKLPKRLRVVRIKDYKMAKVGKNIWLKAWFPMLLTTITIFAYQACIMLEHEPNSINISLLIFSSLVLSKLFFANKYIKKKKSITALIKNFIRDKLISLCPNNLQEKINLFVKKHSRWKRYVAGLSISISMLTLLGDILHLLITFSAHEALWEYLSLSPVYASAFFIYLLFFDSLDFNLEIANAYIQVNLTPEEKAFLYKDDEKTIQSNVTDNMTQAEIKENDKVIAQVNIDKAIKIKNKND